MANRRSTSGRHWQNPEKQKEVDLALAVMCCVARPGCTYGTREIADVTGMSHAAAHYIQKRALKKLRLRAATLFTAL